MSHDDDKSRIHNEAVHAREVTIDLSVPVEIDGVERASLTMRRPRVGDMIEAQKRPGSDAAQEVWLVAKLAAVSPKELEQLDLADWDLCQAALLGFRQGRVS